MIGFSHICLKCFCRAEVGTRGWSAVCRIAACKIQRKCELDPFSTSLIGSFHNERQPESVNCEHWYDDVTTTCWRRDRCRESERKQDGERGNEMEREQR